MSAFSAVKNHHVYTDLGSFFLVHWKFLFGSSHDTRVVVGTPRWRYHDIMTASHIPPLTPLNFGQQLTQRRATWHGFDRSSCQWMTTQEYTRLEDESVAQALSNAFKQGHTQIRMKMTGVNVEAHDPQPIYAFKVARPQADGTDHLLVLRIDPQTGQLMDVRKSPLGFLELHSPIASGHLLLDQWMDRLFTHAAQWHKESYGVGPIAPPVEDSDLEDATQAMLEWTSERAQVLAKRTPPTNNPSSGPRL